MTWRDRDLALELRLMELAAGPRGDGGLARLAHQRAHPGPVRLRDLDLEAMEEYADAANYLRWGIEPIYNDVVVGDPDAVDAYGRRLGALNLTIAAARCLTGR